MGKVRENEEEKEIFPGSGLAWDVIANATGANKILMREVWQRVAASITRQEEGSSSAAIVEENAYEENIQIEYEDPSDKELGDNSIQYEDDNK